MVSWFFVPAGGDPIVVAGMHAEHVRIVMLVRDGLMVDEHQGLFSPRPA